MSELIRSFTWGFGLTLGHAAAKVVGVIILIGCVIVAFLILKQIFKLWRKS